MCYKPTRLYIILETSLTFEFFFKMYYFGSKLGYEYPSLFNTWYRHIIKNDYNPHFT